MAHMISLKIDVTKINKKRLYVGRKGTYLDLMIMVNDEPDRFGNTVKCWEEQTREEREAKAARNFLGNGKVVWSDAGAEHVQPSPEDAAAVPDEEDIPF